MDAPGLRGMASWLQQRQKAYAELMEQIGKVIVEVIKKREQLRKQEEASMKHSTPARCTAAAVKRPACVTRVGPTRCSVSAPRSKSSASFTRLVPTWIRSAAGSAPGRMQGGTRQYVLRRRVA